MSKGGISLYDPDGKDLGIPRLFVGDVVMYLREDIYGPDKVFGGPLCYILASTGAVGAFSDGSDLGRNEEAYFEEATGKPE